MPKKVVDHAVQVVRDDKSQIVPPGTAFDFTDAELADITAAQGEDAIRDPKNEDPGAAADPKKITKETPKKPFGGSEPSSTEPL